MIDSIGNLLNLSLNINLFYAICFLRQMALDFRGIVLEKANFQINEGYLMNLKSTIVMH